MRNSQQVCEEVYEGPTATSGIGSRSEFGRRSPIWKANRSDAVVIRTRTTCVAVLMCVGLVSASCRRLQVATTVNPASIRAIKVGMTEQQVKAVLGEPLQIRPWGQEGV